MSTTYDQLRQARLACLRQRAASARQEAQQYQQAAEAIAQHIPLGQPILVGHHSEHRHHRDLDRIQTSSEKSWQAQTTATALDQRAQAAEHNHAVSSRDPGALAKLQAKLAALEAKQAEMKRVNTAYRKGTLAELGWSAEAVQRLQEKLAQAQSWEQQPYPGWELRNNSAEIRRTKQRIAELTTLSASRPGEDIEVPGLRVVYNDDPVRIELYFDAKPDEDTRASLKRQGFRWSRFSRAWLAQDTQARREFVQGLLAQRQQST